MDGKFHLYAVMTIDQGIEILTGVMAGERQPEGTFPEGTVNFLVDTHLREYAEKLKGYDYDATGRCRDRITITCSPIKL